MKNLYSLLFLINTQNKHNSDKSYYEKLTKMKTDKNEKLVQFIVFN